MSQIVAQSNRTEHAWLVLLGEYARQSGLTAALNAVPLQQKVRTHRPQTKVIEFLVAILAAAPERHQPGRSSARPGWRRGVGMATTGLGGLQRREPGAPRSEPK